MVNPAINSRRHAANTDAMIATGDPVSGEALPEFTSAGSAPVLAVPGSPSVGSVHGIIVPENPSAIFVSDNTAVWLVTRSEYVLVSETIYIVKLNREVP